MGTLMMYFEISRQFDSSNKRGKNVHTCAVRTSVQLQHQSGGSNVWNRALVWHHAIAASYQLSSEQHGGTQHQHRNLRLRPLNGPLQPSPHPLLWPHPWPQQILRLGRADWPLIPVFYKRASKYTQHLIKVGHPLLKPITVLWDEKVISPPSP